jgi:hypothetical protein
VAPIWIHTTTTYVIYYVGLNFWRLYERNSTR